MIDPSEYASYTVLTVATFEFFLLSTDASILDAIFGFLPPDELVLLRRVSRRTAAAVDYYMTRAWNVSTFLAPWFHHPFISDFLEQIDQWNAVVSGSAALRFLDRSPPLPGSDLDIYVPLSGLLELGRWIQQHGYVYVPRGAGPLFYFDVAALTLPGRWMAKQKTNQPWYNVLGFSTVFEVFDFERTDIPPPSPHAVPQRRPKIQLIAVERDPREHLLTFHSTVVMNFFTGTYAASLFPISTFTDRVSWICRETFMPGYKSGAAWREKYRSRGFQMMERWSGMPCPPEPLELEGFRSVADSHTWVLRLGCEADGVKLRKELELQDILFEIVTDERGPVRPGTYMWIAPAFTVSACTFAGSAEYEEQWPYGGTLETFAAFGV